MRIAVNTRLLIPNKLDGIGWFTHEVMQRMVKLQPEWEFVFLFDRPFDVSFLYAENVRGKVIFPPARHPLLYRWYFDWSIPQALDRIRPDLFFSPDGFLSLRTKVKQVPVIHDINFEHRPQDLPKAYRHYYRTHFPRFAQVADRIITVSQYSADDIARTYHVDPEKITVAHNGGNAAYRPLSEQERSEARQRFTAGKPYFVFVGNFSYRKNIHGIVKAFDIYRKAGGGSSLLLVGNPLWRYREMGDAISASEFRQDIVFAGHLAIAELTRAMGGAQALVFPSYFEGFGIPVLEAFMTEVPVIISNVTALPEIAKNAAILCSPDDHIQIANAMASLEQDLTYRSMLIENGKKRSKDFSWDFTANKVIFALLKSISR